MIVTAIRYEKMPGVIGNRCLCNDTFASYRRRMREADPALGEMVS
jgi:hypothetical protein